jgi:hypothetical protein
LELPLCATPDELAHVGKLLTQYPECASEAELLRQATMIGLYVLAAQATGQPAQLLDQLFRLRPILSNVKQKRAGFLDRVVIALFSLAMAAQHFQFLRELRSRWYVASLGIACNQALGGV